MSFKNNNCVCVNYRYYLIFKMSLLVSPNLFHFLFVTAKLVMQWPWLAASFWETIQNLHFKWHTITTLAFSNCKIVHSAVYEHRYIYIFYNCTFLSDFSSNIFQVFEIFICATESNTNTLIEQFYSEIRRMKTQKHKKSLVCKIATMIMNCIY